jgi:N-hydroxyarylamine O-acetyltransferase
VNTGAYFERIGWRGPRAATPEVLGGIVAHHMRAIPFENLDVLLGRPPRLDLPSLEQKLVTDRRGGYCYEHATLVAAVLAELGFAVKTHSARVVMVTPRTAAPRTHMFLTVGDVMLDPGFGATAPLGPVPLDGTPFGAHRLVRDGNELALEHEGKRLWVSSLEHDIPIDFVMANHFTATHPSSHFTQAIMARAFTADGEVRVRNRDVTLTRGGETQTYQLADRRALRELLAQHFGFDLPEVESMRVPQIAEWT